MRDRFDGLSLFLSVARRKSFRAAASELGITPGAVSQAIRALESRVGLPLFQRTTRRVSLTDAGEALFARVGPAAAEIDGALDTLDGLRKAPSGLLRLTVPRLAVELFLEPVLPLFHAAFPEVAVEVSVDDAFVDLAESGFDAGIRIGDAVAKDMIGVRLTEDLVWHVAGSPSYFARYGHPREPRDLLAHRAIRYRYSGSKAIYRWEFVEKGREVVIDVPGPFTVNEGRLAFALARQGIGLFYASHPLLAADLQAGTLVTTLDAFAPTSPGFYLYYAARSRAQPKVSAFVQTILEVVGRKPARAGRTRAMGPAVVSPRGPKGRAFGRSRGRRPRRSRRSSRS